MLSNSYLPAVMQAVAYYLELLKYEVVEKTTIEPPFTIPQSDPDALTITVTNPSNKVPDPTTTKKPYHTTARPITHPSPTASHAPGYYAPVSGMMFTSSPSKLEEMEDEGGNSLSEKPAASVAPMSVSNNNQFISWFLQTKEETVAPKTGMYTGMGSQFDIALVLINPEQSLDTS